MDLNGQELWMIIKRYTIFPILIKHETSKLQFEIYSYSLVEMCWLRGKWILFFAPFITDIVFSFIF